MLLCDFIDGPPEDALLALNALGLVVGLGHRVILAGEAADQDIMRRHLAGGDGIFDQLVAVLGILGVREFVFVDPRGPLLGAPGFELVAPDDLKGLPIKDALKPNSESTHAGEELNDPIGLTGCLEDGLRLLGLLSFPLLEAVDDPLSEL